MPNPTTTDANSAVRLEQLLKDHLGALILESTLDLGDLVVRIAPNSVRPFFERLKKDSDLDFNLLIDITAVDWMDLKPERFEVVYHLLSLSKLHRLRVKVALPEAHPEIESLTPFWAGANFMERETWDMYGVVFKGHPELKRLLMYDEFKGHPLRKDYPVQGKQPRIKLRSPEVRNTAVDMKRPALVKINSSRVSN